MAATGGAANVLIKLQLVGDRQVRAGMKATADQTIKEGQRATREAASNAKKEERDAKRMRRSIVKETQRAYAEQKAERAKDLRDAERSVAKKAADEKKALRDVDKEREKLAAKEKRRRQLEMRDVRRAWNEQQQQLRTAERLRRQQRTVGERRFAAGVAGAGVLAGTAVSAARASQGVLGIRDQDSIVSDSIAARQALIAQVRAAGGSGAQADQIFNRTIATARSANVSPVEALQTVTRLNEQFSSLGTALQGGEQGLDDFFATLEGNAQLARASTDSTENVSMAMAALATQFGLTAEQQVEARGLLFQGAQEGALTMRDFGQLFPEVIAPFLSARGAEGAGLAGLREFTALGQTIQATTNNPSRTRTLVGAMLQNLSDENVQTRLGASIADGGLGINARNAAGDLRSPAAIAHDMALMARTNPGLLTSTAYRSIFHDQEASAGFAALVQQDLRGNGALGRIGVNAATGNAGILSTSAALNADASGRAMAMANEREANILRNSEQLLEANIAVAEGLTHMEDAFPRLTMVLDRLSPLLQALVGVAAAKAVLPGSFFSTLGGGTAPLSGSVINPATGAVGYPGAGGPVAAMGGAAGGAAVRLQQLGVAVAGFEVGLRGTQSILDDFMREGLLGSQLQREGGSASQDYADFSVAKLLAGRYNVGDAIFGGQAHNQTATERRLGYQQDTGVLANPMVQGALGPVGLALGMASSNRTALAQTANNPKANAEVIRATQAQTNALLGPLGLIVTAIQNIPNTGGATGDTTTRGQSQ